MIRFSTLTPLALIAPASSARSSARPVCPGDAEPVIGLTPDKRPAGELAVLAAFENNKASMDRKNVHIAGRQFDIVISAPKLSAQLCGAHECEKVNAFGPHRHVRKLSQVTGPETFMAQ